MTPEQGLTVQVRGPDSTSSRGLKLEIAVLSASGQALSRDEVDAPALNEDIPVDLPVLAPGLFRLEITLLQGGEQAQKSTITLFAVKELPRISGITSFPPVITASSPVLLRAELGAPAGADPYLRWSWRSKTIGRGLASAGTTQLLWTAPGVEGVYTVSLELFPVAPSGEADFPFQSPVAMSTDIYVTAAGKAQEIELGPESSYWSLFHLRGNLVDSGVGARGAANRGPAAIGSPKVVPSGDGFAYRLDGSSGFKVPRMTLPLDGARLAPFTVSVGLEPERLAGTNRVFEASAEDGSFSFLLDLDASGIPEAVLTAAGAQPVRLASGAERLPTGTRSLVSVSFIPGLGRCEARWFIDGRQVSSAFVPFAAPSLRGQGTTVVGGEQGFVGTIDEVGVYYRDAQSRPSPDPTLFAASARVTYGDQLLLADGFDGLFVPVGFTAGDEATLDAGSLLLPPGSSLELPAIAPGDGCTISLALGRDSSQAARVQLTWEGADAPFLEATATAEAGVITLAVDGETVSATTPEGPQSWQLAKPPAERSGLLVRVAPSSGAVAPLAIADVLALRLREKE